MMYSRLTRRLMLVFAYICVFLSVNFTNSQLYADVIWDGSGTEEDPYQIGEPNQLMAIGANPEFLDKHFILINDIVFDPNNNPNHVFTAAIIAPRTEEGDLEFLGVFDGNGYTISQLRIEGIVDEFYGDRYENWRAGLFGTISVNGIVKNIKLADGDVTGQSATGILASHNYGTIINCSASGRVKVGVWADSFGGLVGDNSGTIISCYADAEVIGAPASYGQGGLVGWNNYGYLISSCSASGNVNGYESVGGLVGINAGLIEYSTSDTTVDGEADSTYIGGFCGGNNMGTISNCYCHGQVNGSTSVGGLVGSNQGTFFPGYPPAVIENCYSIGTVLGDSSSGGLVGSVMFTNVISESYFLDTAGINNGLGTPLSDAAMKQQISYIGWDFMSIWRLCADGLYYPRLWWDVEQAGDYSCPDGVGIDDLAALSYSWFSVEGESNFSYACDASEDGQIDEDDLEILIAHWLE